MSSEISRSLQDETENPTVNGSDEVSPQERSDLKSHSEEKCLNFSSPSLSICQETGVLAMETITIHGLWERSNFIPKIKTCLQSVCCNYLHDMDFEYNDYNNGWAGTSCAPFCSIARLSICPDSY